ncbi:BBSome-interacting protein 1 [Dissostichus eleginoides]|nr:BBSome-interacting protein 1 [Dissostichus eleginoides]
MLYFTVSVGQVFSFKPQEDTMPEVKSIFREVLPKQGQLSMEDVPTMVLCKPKLLPLKSVTLEKLEKMQMEAQKAVKLQELAMKEQNQ